MSPLGGAEPQPVGQGEGSRATLKRLGRSGRTIAAPAAISISRRGEGSSAFAALVHEAVWREGPELVR